MRVLVIGAGGPAGVNTCRALYEAGHDVFAQDDVREHLIWAKPYLAEYDLGEIDVVMPQPDKAVLEWASHPEYVGGPISSSEPPAKLLTFLPKPQTVALCQDKFECGLAWRRAGLREDRIELVDDRTMWSGDGFPYWIRARHGAGAKAAIAMRRISEGAWMDFWRARDPQIEFIREAFLPGRDYSWCGIYREGELLVSFARERLEYIYPHLTPEGLTGTPTRAQVVHSADVDEMAGLAVSVIDEKPHGIFCVDLREDADGQPRPTEINAGRFSTTVGLWSIYSLRSNFVALAAELALGNDSRLEAWESLPEGLTLNRHIDCGHVFTRAPVLA